MSLTQTKAATYLQEHAQEDISSHKVIALLMDGAMERIDQAIDAVRRERYSEVEVLKEKLAAIVEGLRNSLNREAGGEVADNLDELYSYMLRRLSATENDSMASALVEVRSLLGEVKYGWDNMDSEAQAE